MSSYVSGVKRRQLDHSPSADIFPPLELALCAAVPTSAALSGLLLSAVVDVHSLAVLGVQLLPTVCGDATAALRVVKHGAERLLASELASLRHGLIPGFSHTTDSHSGGVNRFTSMDSRFASLTGLLPPSAFARRALAEHMSLPEYNWVTTPTRGATYVFTRLVTALQESVATIPATSADECHDRDDNMREHQPYHTLICNKLRELVSAWNSTPYEALRVLQGLDETCSVDLAAGMQGAHLVDVNMNGDGLHGGTHLTATQTLEGRPQAESSHVHDIDASLGVGVLMSPPAPLHSQPTPCPAIAWDRLGPLIRSPFGLGAGVNAYARTSLPSPHAHPTLTSTTPGMCTGMSTGMCEDEEMQRSGQGDRHSGRVVSGQTTTAVTTSGSSRKALRPSDSHAQRHGRSSLAPWVERFGLLGLPRPPSCSTPSEALLHSLLTSLPIAEGTPCVSPYESGAYPIRLSVHGCFVTCPSTVAEVSRREEGGTVAFSGAGAGVGVSSCSGSTDLSTGTEGSRVMHSGNSGDFSSWLRQVAPATAADGMSASAPTSSIRTSAPASFHSTHSLLHTLEHGASPSHRAPLALPMWHMPLTGAPCVDVGGVEAFTPQPSKYAGLFPLTTTLTSHSSTSSGSSSGGALRQPFSGWASIAHSPVTPLATSHFLSTHLSATF